MVSWEVQERERKLLLSHEGRKSHAVQPGWGCLAAGGGEHISQQHTACLSQGWDNSLGDQKPYVPFWFWWPFSMTIFFSLLDNLFLVKVSRLTARNQTHLLATVKNQCRHSPEYYSQSIQAFVLHVINCGGVEWLSYVTTSILPMQGMESIYHHFLWFYKKRWTRSKAVHDKLQQFLNLTWNVYLPGNFVFQSSTP